MWNRFTLMDMFVMGVLTGISLSEPTIPNTLALAYLGTKYAYILKSSKTRKK